MKQRQILNELSPDFCRDGQTDYTAKSESLILRFIDSYIEAAHADGAVIGISGGIDSFLVGALLAKSFQGTGRRLIAVMLPNGAQSDLADAIDCAVRIRDIYPETEVETINIASAFAAVHAALAELPGFESDTRTLGNVQPRLRMLYQYALAKNLLVAGTDHCSESVTGFYTKYGDGGTDFNPIGQLIKDDIYTLSETLGAPEAVMKKKPAAGIGISEDDESELGISYTDICAFLKGYPIPETAESRLVRLYESSAHKRTVPPTPAWLFRIDHRVTHIHVCGAAAEQAASYMNEHPHDEVLYVGDPDPLFVKTLYKTVNTPLKRYNCFSAGALENENFGQLLSNVNKVVKLSGSLAQMAAIHEQLAEKGLHSTVLNEASA